MTPTRIRAIAGLLAKTAFDEAIVIDQPWTDFRGERHEQMIGRPVSPFTPCAGFLPMPTDSRPAGRCTCCKSCWARWKRRGGMRFKPPYPKPFHAHPKPHAKAMPNSPLEGPHLGFPHGPEDLCLSDNGQPQRIDKAFTWENPLSAHGLMHMVISNAHAGDPYSIDTLMLYMANMAWNSSMNTRAVMEMLTDTDQNGDYIIPRIIYSDAYSSEMVAYADLILPDTTYLERHDCISLLDRPISEPEAAADAIRWPVVVEPDRDVRGFQSVLVDLANRLDLPASSRMGSRSIATTPTISPTTSASPASARWRGWRMGENRPDRRARRPERGAA